MQDLNDLDAAFLHVETPETPMHVGSLHLFELPPGAAGSFHERVRAHLAARLHMAPVFHRKLATMPFDLANPLWIEDEDIDLDYHVRPLLLPAPGRLAQLQSLAGRLHSSLCARSRPLWEVYVIEGVEGGHAALYLKAARCLRAGLDGGLRTLARRVESGLADRRYAETGGGPARPRSSRRSGAPCEASSAAPRRRGVPICESRQSGTALASQHAYRNSCQAPPPRTAGAKLPAFNRGAEVLLQHIAAAAREPDGVGHG